MTENIKLTKCWPIFYNVHQYLEKISDPYLLSSFFFKSKVNAILHVWLLPHFILTGIKYFENSY